MSAYCATCNFTISLPPGEFITICNGCSGVVYSTVTTVQQTRPVTVDDIRRQREMVAKRLGRLEEREDDLAQNGGDAHPELERQLEKISTVKWQVQQELKVLDMMEAKLKKTADKTKKTWGETAARSEDDGSKVKEKDQDEREEEEPFELIAEEANDVCRICKLPRCSGATCQLQCQPFKFVIKNPLDKQTSTFQITNPSNYSISWVMELLKKMPVEDIDFTMNPYHGILQPKETVDVTVTRDTFHGRKSSNTSLTITYLYEELAPKDLVNGVDPCRILDIPIEISEETTSIQLLDDGKGRDQAGTATTDNVAAEESDPGLNISAPMGLPLTPRPTTPPSAYGSPAPGMALSPDCPLFPPYTMNMAQEKQSEKEKTVEDPTTGNSRIPPAPKMAPGMLPPGLYSGRPYPGLSLPPLMPIAASVGLSSQPWGAGMMPHQLSSWPMYPNYFNPNSMGMMSTMPGLAKQIIVSPQSRITFNGPFDRVQNSQIKLKNPHSCRIAWKITCTSSITGQGNRIEVNPTTGILEPEVETAVTVSCKTFCPTEMMTYVNHIYNDHLMIEWLVIPAHVVNQSFEQLQGGMYHRSCRSFSITYNA